MQGLAYLVADVTDPAAWRRFVEQIFGAQIDEADGRLDLAHQRVRRLSEENEQLRDELPRAYGRLRDPRLP